MTRCGEVLGRLEVLLESGDMAAGLLARKEKVFLQQALGSAADPMLSAIEIFDFELALVELRQTSKEMAQPVQQ